MSTPRAETPDLESFTKEQLEAFIRTCDESIKTADPSADEGSQDEEGSQDGEDLRERGKTPSGQGEGTDSDVEILETPAESKGKRVSFSARSHVVSAHRFISAGQFQIGSRLRFRRVPLCLEPQL